MIIKIKFLILASIFIIFSGCSSFTDSFDIASIIDKTENWIFNEEGDKDENEDTFNKSETLEEKQDNDEEFFPDVNQIPEEKPVFDQRDQEFFSEKNDMPTAKNDFPEEVKLKESKSEQITLPKYIIKKDKNAESIFNIRQNVRLKILDLLMQSDPPVDENKPIIVSSKSEVSLEKIAIIQFPNNSIIPDENANKVIEEISQFYGSRTLRLVGHSSRTGSSTAQGKRRNMQISIARAEAIKNMLINNGFSAEKIYTFGKGDVEPLKKEAEQYGEGINRRVEIFFISE